MKKLFKMETNKKKRNTKYKTIFIEEGLQGRLIIFLWVRIRILDPCLLHFRIRIGS
jgi:hypothetical protein